MTATTATHVRRRFSRRTRNTVLAIHIVASVGLLGDSAGFLAVAIRGTTTDDLALERSSYELLRMFSYVFGIPLSFASLVTGVALGLGTVWGVLRSPWVTAKLCLILSVIAVGALAIDPALTALAEGEREAEAPLLVAATWQVVALTIATGLSVFKPGGRGWSGLPVGNRSTAGRNERRGSVHRTGRDAASDRYVGTVDR